MSQAPPRETFSARALFAARAQFLRERFGISQAEAVLAMKRRGMKKTQKTLSNVERTSTDSRISTYEAAAASYGVPLWVMFLPGISNEMLADGVQVERLKQLIEHYLACSEDDRRHIENMAAAFSARPTR